jgi:Holliday junction resolvase-like predicted endonuclease
MNKLNRKELEEFKKSKEYNYLQRFYDDSGCNNPQFVGHCMKIIKDAQPKTFDDWISYYVGHDAYKFTNGMVEASGRLQDYILETQKKRIKTKTCWDAIAVIVLFNTWNGYKMELKAIDELQEDDYEILQTNSNQDEKYAIDLIIHKNNKVLLGIQVKPSKYAHLSEEKKQVNKNKNYEFINKYNVGVKYLYYDENYEFDKKDIEKIKEKVRKAMLCKVL